ncbi:AAA family ATPase [Clostridium faecium]|uniref:endopeptidase La n=1 Tax=Clostridium faecium TaxID=2762223 RepID=A0ABR8YQG4_9CLOT|nr:AAA family ATPase [Clostridium faecium]MBD8046459.1 AAA family ATPase [Clostridium faecium]
MKRKLTPKEVIYNFEFGGISPKKDKYMLPQYSEAYKKIKTALEIDKEGYNVYLVDDYSMDKVKTIIEYIENVLKDRERPDDICYVVRNDEKKPVPIFVTNGFGKKFKNALENIQNSLIEYTFEFYNNSISKEKEKLIDTIQKKRNEIINNLIVISKSSGFEIKSNDGGFTFIPLNNGREMTEEEYESLDSHKKELMISKVNELKLKAKDILEELKLMEINELEKIKDIMRNYLNEKLNTKRVEYKKIFYRDKEVVEYLDYVCDSIVTYLIENYSINYDDDEDKINEIIYKYMINVIVDNSDQEYPPVIFEEDPNLNNLLGSIEYENHSGIYVSDVSLIKAGSLIRANGGCLILRVNNLLSNPQAYYYLKKVLLSEKVDLDYNKGYLELLALSGLKPKPINVRQKVILIGDYETYDLLYTYDEDFKKIFKIRTEYNPILDINKDVKRSLINEINNFSSSNNIRQLTEEAIKQIAKYLSRKAENKNKIYFENCDICNLILLANNKVKEENRDIIDGKDIIDIAYEEELIEKEILQNYKEKKTLIEVVDSKVGQINGLSIIDTGYVSFGKPIKITCMCYKGEGNIIDTQRDSNLSGKIHNKALSILKGYISTLNGGYKKLPIDLHLSFEQIYGIINGDSASIAEVICIISSISKIPIKQNIAVTGSINQFGEVQPIGGVNQKIEGFFKVCKAIDSIENKGVLIPASNKDDLVLCEEVEVAVKEGKFSIYTMTSVEDAVRVLLDKPSINFDKVIKILNKEIEKYNDKNNSQSKDGNKTQEIKDKIID